MQDHSDMQPGPADEKAQKARETRSDRRTIIALALITGLSLAGIIIGFVQRLMQS